MWWIQSSPSHREMDVTRFLNELTDLVNFFVYYIYVEEFKLNNLILITDGWNSSQNLY